MERARCAQTTQAFNVLADKMDEILHILLADETDADQQIRNRYIDITNTNGRIWADPYMDLANTKKKASDKLEMLAVLQKRQQFTATAFENMTFSDKGKSAASSADTSVTSSGTQPAAAGSPNKAPAITTSATSWGPEQFLESLRPL